MDPGSVHSRLQCKRIDRNKYSIFTHQDTNMHYSRFVSIMIATKIASQLGRTLIITSF